MPWSWDGFKSNQINQLKIYCSWLVQIRVFVGLYSLSHISHTCSAVAEMGDLLATIDMGRKVGVLCPF